MILIFHIKDFELCLGLKMKEEVTLYCFWLEKVSSKGHENGGSF